MLCLNCGKEIGDKIGLCQECEEQSSAEDTEQQQDETTEEDSESESSPDSDAEQETQLQDSISDTSSDEQDDQEQDDGEQDDGEQKDSSSSEEQAKQDAATIDADAIKKDDTEEATAVPKDSTRSMLVPGLLLGLVLVVVVVGYLIFGGESTPDEPETTVVPPEAGETTPPQEPLVAEPAEDEIEFPTAPHFASGSLLIDGRRTSFSDVVFIYYPFVGRIEVGFYPKKLSLELKQKMIGLQSLHNASNDIKPVAVFTLHTEPGVTVCTTSGVKSWSVRFYANGKNIEKGAFFDFKNATGGIVGLACQLKMGSPFSFEVSQSTSKQAAGKRQEFSWDLTASGPVYVLATKPKMSFNSKSYWQLGLWDKENKSLGVGFFRERLNAEERLLVRENRDLSAVAGKKPDFKVSFEVVDGVTDFRRTNLRSFGVHFMRSEGNDGRGFSFPGEKEEIGLYEIVSSEPSASLEDVSGYLFEAESVKATLKGSQEKEIEGSKVVFDWDVSLSSPVIDVLSEPVSSVVFDPDLAKINRAVPQETGGTIEAGKASAKIVDAMALFYPSEGNLVLGLYTSKLSDKHKKLIVRNKGVWQRSRVPSPNLVITLELKKGETTFSRSTINKLRFTFVRDRLGDFFFPGTYDRATIKKETKDFSDANLPYVAGLAENAGNIAMRINGSHVSQKSGLAFSWKLEVSEAIAVIE